MPNEVGTLHIACLATRPSWDNRDIAHGHPHWERPKLDREHLGTRILRRQKAEMEAKWMLVAMVRFLPGVECKALRDGTVALIGVERP